MAITNVPVFNEYQHLRNQVTYHMRITVWVTGTFQRDVNSSNNSSSGGSCDSNHLSSLPTCSHPNATSYSHYSIQFSSLDSHCHQIENGAYSAYRTFLVENKKWGVAARPFEMATRLQLSIISSLWLSFPNLSLRYASLILARLRQSPPGPSMGYRPG